MAQGQQTINIGDLDIAQLSDVKKQLEEVGSGRCYSECQMLIQHSDRTHVALSGMIPRLTGAQSSHELICTT